ncbi:DUF1614 domain-containing protein [Rhodoblastus acidophilus]|uniref:DUF1614 domain-containing protein n=1 Tax=Candidatus Rhodoblastus alkanivorans TaxID=2954117 RepID=A0ABS9ZA45_9HYPH|nr:DUF1614 domain-containing protein [Candidatus Rhodoblastus alkanivorans]MCI4678851.1 DUF1614 domain-containing protein [Candidatus Rhodoblastus alkanivorans]MCI4684225.1 DUF1614 domain-containing protein [Candidatus Rhodoblastus alkanivorans]MDI4641546.1 DUF1614 domain-containing protein [Rhodoblastus acidophilus]
MNYSEMHYLPLALPFFTILVGAFILLIVLLQIGVLSYAYTRLGVSLGGAYLLLVGSLVGSYFNIPVGELPGRNIMVGREIVFYGIHYVVPLIVPHPGTIIAINVGGAVIPGLMSLYLLFRHQLWAKGIVATAVVAAVCHGLAKPVPGLGIALPVFVPAAVTALVAILLSRREAAPLAYIAGSLGVLIGADLLNLGHIQGLGAPIASIGGAGTFDGIYLCGILAVLLASLSGRPDQRTAPR